MSEAEGRPCGCGSGDPTHGASSYFSKCRLRQAQVCKASARKHGRDLTSGVSWIPWLGFGVGTGHLLCAPRDQLTGSAPSDPAWTEVFRVLSVASIKFEMLSTAPQSQVSLGTPPGPWWRSRECGGCPLLQLCPP